jgi:(2R)-sulfolactate sulfo-lyase subunit alpha
MKPQFLVHNKSDNLGVAVVDIKPGDKISGACLENGAQYTIEAKDGIPLGHKVALKELKKGEDVIKYGISIGKATQSIVAGNHVHVHNLKTNRW